MEKEYHIMRMEIKNKKGILKKDFQMEKELNMMLMEINYMKEILN